MHDLKTGIELYRFAKAFGRASTKRLLRQYVTEGEPHDFMPGYTSRAMCRIASAGLEGLAVDKAQSYIDTKYGSELYFHMWGGESLSDETQFGLSGDMDPGIKGSEAGFALRRAIEHERKIEAREIVDLIDELFAPFFEVFKVAPSKTKARLSGDTDPGIKSITMGGTLIDVPLDGRAFPITDYAELFNAIIPPEPGDVLIMDHRRNVKTTTRRTPPARKAGPLSFADFQKQIMRHVAIHYQIPYSLLNMDFSDAERRILWRVLPPLPESLPTHKFWPTPRPTVSPVVPDFSEAKIGDKVFALDLGWGEVVSLYAGGLVVEFEGRFAQLYLVDGRECEEDINQMLYWDEVKIEPPARPKKPAPKYLVKYRNCDMNCESCKERTSAQEYESIGDFKTRNPWIAVISPSLVPVQVDDK